MTQQEIELLSDEELVDRYNSISSDPTVSLLPRSEILKRMKAGRGLPETTKNQ